MRNRPFLIIATFALICAPVASAMDNDATVPTYHGDAARSGHYVVPGLTWATAGSLQQDTSFDGRVPGHVYAQPLYWHPAGATSGLVIVATEENSVVALDAITGKTVWQQTLGPPTARNALPCGNIDPLGITGTPVIDERGGALYVDAMIDRGGGPRHWVFGLSLSDGSVLPGWPIDTATSLAAIDISFDPRMQNQRGALAMVGDQLYVPYSGHYGSCGDYHGSVVGFRLNKPGAFGAWRAVGNGGGNWAPGGIAFDGKYLFIGTSPSTPHNGEWSGGNAVIRLPTDLDWRPTSQDFFAVSDRSWLNDLGGGNPMPIDLSNEGAYSSLLIAFARGGTAYLLDRTELGGIDKPLYSQRIANSGTIVSPATYRIGNDTMVAFQGTGTSCPADQENADGVVALRVSDGPQPSIQTAWCAKMRGSQEGTIVTTSDETTDPIVWIVGAEADERLHGFRGDNGQEVFKSALLPGLRHFVTILAAADRLYFAGDGQIFAFGLPK